MTRRGLGFCVACLVAFLIAAASVLFWAVDAREYQQWMPVLMQARSTELKAAKREETAEPAVKPGGKPSEARSTDLNAAKREETAEPAVKPGGKLPEAPPAASEAGAPGKAEAPAARPAPEPPKEPPAKPAPSALVVDPAPRLPPKASESGEVPTCWLEGSFRKGFDIQPMTEEPTALDCQARCSFSVGCAYFTYWPKQKHCHVQSEKAELAKSGDALTGPPECVQKIRQPSDGQDRGFASVLEKAGNCFYRNASFSGSPFMKASWEPGLLECQRRCAFVLGCRWFTYRPDSMCDIFGKDAKRSAQTQQGAISGPPRCSPRSTAPRAMPTCPRPPPSLAERGGLQPLDLDACAADFPAYLRYLDRKFGHNRTLDPLSKASVSRVQQKSHTKTYSFNMTPSRSAEIEVQGVISSGSVPMVFALVLRPDGTVQIDTPVRGISGHKFSGVKKMMVRVAKQHGQLLVEELKKLGGRVQLLWRGIDADFPSAPITEGVRFKGGLPLHGYSSDAHHWDIAMPDFTFEDYPEIRSEKVNSSWKSNSWWEVSKRLRGIARERRGIIFRGKPNAAGTRSLLNAMVALGPPNNALRELLEDFAPDGLNVSVGFANEKPSNFASLYEQCRWAYTFHVSGTHYSAMLKYKLACGQTVFFVGDGSDEEFWYDALKDQENVFFIDPNRFWQSLYEVLRPPKDKSSPSAAERAACVAAAGQRLVDTYLSQRGLDCYMMLYLKRYYLPLLLR